MTEAVDAFTLSPEQATAQLAEMTTAHRGKLSEHPGAQLERLSRDAEWFQKLQSGNAEVRREFQQLTKAAAEADPVEAVMSGSAPATVDTDFQVMQFTAASLRDVGASEAVVKQALSGDKVSRAEFDAVKRWKTDALRNPEWTKKLLAGDPEARRQLALAHVVLTSEIKEDAA